MYGSLLGEMLYWIWKHSTLIKIISWVWVHVSSYFTETAWFSRLFSRRSLVSVGFWCCFCWFSSILNSLLHKQHTRTNSDILTTNQMRPSCCICIMNRDMRNVSRNVQTVKTHIRLHIWSKSSRFLSRNNKSRGFHSAKSLSSRLTNMSLFLFFPL